jgi:hypothetical protein
MSSVYFLPISKEEEKKNEDKETHQKPSATRAYVCTEIPAGPSFFGTIAPWCLYLFSCGIEGGSFYSPTKQQVNIAPALFFVTYLSIFSC